VLGTLLFSGCGDQITFTKVDLRGHVRVVGPVQGEGYCFKVPPQWEIREDLEGADVVCLSPPVKGKFRESVVARSVSALDLKDPQATITAQLEKLGEKVNFVEPWDNQGAKPMLVELADTRFSALSLGQLLFVHKKPDGSGILICCTTVGDDMAKRRPEFEAMVAEAKFDLTQCPGPGGVPDNFPTPEVTFSPAAAATPAVPTPAPASSAAAVTTPAPAAPPADVATPSTAAPSATP
jgi:hypothetical protein